MNVRRRAHGAGDPRRHARLSLAAMFILLAASLGAATFISAATPVTAGYQDHLYGDPNVPGGDDVTAPRNQSKVWFHDGKWHGLLLDNATAKYRIYKFDMATQNWTSTGVQVDERNRSHGDALADGNTLWVASAYNSAVGTAAKDLRVYKFTYNGTTKVYKLSSGYPKLIPGTSTGTKNATIAKDTTGVLWVAYTQNNRVKVASSINGGTTWTTADLPGMVNDATSDDMAAIAPITSGGVNGVGVMWGNQSAPSDDAFYYQAHKDGDPIGTWQAVEVVMGTPGVETYTADDSISLKTDLDGRAIAAIKTSKNADPGPNGSDPLVAVVRRSDVALDVAGTWTVHTVTNVTTKGTRPLLVIDSQNSQANVFLTHPTLDSDGTQVIYRRTAPLSTLSFGASSLGTAVISSATELAINDANSSKQAATAPSGMLIIAANIPTRRYMHACIGDPCPVAPVADFTANKTSGPAPLAVQFTDSTTNTPTSWAWDFDNDGLTNSTAQSPLYTYLQAGTYTVKLTATNVAGSSIKTRTSYITVSEGPKAGYFPIDPVRLLDSRTGNGLSGVFSANVARTWQIGDRSGIPADAIAVTGNLTVVGQTKAGYISIGPDPTVLGATSSINFPVKDIRANGVTLPLSALGKLSAVYKAPAGATTHLAFDVTGYFVLSTNSGATYNEVTPVRLLDTRYGNGLSGMFLSGTPRTFQITGREGIPGNATAITANLTVVGQTNAGYVSLGPVAEVSPQTSTINFPVNDIRANGVTVKLSGTGTLSAVYKAAAGGTHLLLDITGYFTNDSGGARFVALNPARVLDTRAANGLSGVFLANTPRTWTVGGRGGVDIGAVAVIGNVTVVNQTKAGYAAVTPTSNATPGTSTINFPVGDIRANGLTVKLGAAGALSSVYKASTGSTHLIFDVFGYYK